jgi:hypothetical protein
MKVFDAAAAVPCESETNKSNGRSGREKNVHVSTGREQNLYDEVCDFMRRRLLLSRALLHYATGKR